MSTLENQYTLGRGTVFFLRKDPVTGELRGEKYLGNTPSFSVSFEPEKLEHYSSDRGIREKDKSVILQVNRTGSLTTDNVSPENIGLFFFGENSEVTTAETTVIDEVVGGTIGVEVGMYYQLGTTDENPSGVREVMYPGAGATAFSLEKAGVALVHGTDYIVDSTLGRIEILEGGSVLDGDVLSASYTTAASTRQRIISGSTPIEGAVRFIADNPTGNNVDYFFPSVTLTPDGEYALKGEEWQEIPFTMEILKPAGKEAIYMDGRAVV